MHLCSSSSSFNFLYLLFSTIIILPVHLQPTNHLITSPVIQPQCLCRTSRFEGWSTITKSCQVGADTFCSQCPQNFKCSNWVLLWSDIFTFCSKSRDLKTIKKTMVFIAKKLLLDREIAGYSLTFSKTKATPS